MYDIFRRDSETGQLESVEPEVVVADYLEDELDLDVEKVVERAQRSLIERLVAKIGSVLSSVSPRGQ